MSLAAAGQKRPGMEYGGALVPMKQPRLELVAASGDARKQLMQSGPPRTSSLEAPIMQLFGHEGEVYSAKFSPDGATLASASFERLIFLWNVYGECENFGVMKGHSGAIMEIHYSTDGSNLFSASIDKTAAVWDCKTGTRVKKLKGHTSFVNSCCPSRRGTQYLATGSDDGTIKLWDVRKKGAVQTFNATYQVTAVCFNDTSDQIISGGLDNELKVWDLRHNKVVYSMQGHGDTITGLKLSPNGYYVLSNAMDNTEFFIAVERLPYFPQVIALWNAIADDSCVYQRDSGIGFAADPNTCVSASACNPKPGGDGSVAYEWMRVWDARPFAPADRLLKVFQGHQHNFEKNLLRCSWTPDGTKIAAGSADRFVYIWDTVTQRLLYKLPGHLGSVNDVDFHPKEPILLSCSNDKTLYLGELQL